VRQRTWFLLRDHRKCEQHDSKSCQQLLGSHLSSNFFTWLKLNSVKRTGARYSGTSYEHWRHGRPLNCLGKLQFAIYFVFGICGQFYTSAADGTKIPTLSDEAAPGALSWRYAQGCRMFWVVGLGAVGSAALYQSAKLGARAIGIDRFHPPHDQGSSHGDTRITREAIGEGRVRAPGAALQPDLEELEAATSRSLLVRQRSPGPRLARPRPAIIMARPRSSTTLSPRHGVRIAHEVLSTDELRHRYPQFRLRGDEIGYFEPGAGFLRPEACIETQLWLAQKWAPKSAPQKPVVGCKPMQDGTVEVTTGANTYSAAKSS